MNYWILKSWTFDVYNVFCQVFLKYLIKKTQKKMSLCLCLAMHNVPVRQATDRNDTNILSVVIFEGTSLLGQFLPMHENSILG